MWFSRSINDFVPNGSEDDVDLVYVSDEEFTYLIEHQVGFGFKVDSDGKVVVNTEYIPPEESSEQILQRQSVKLQSLSWAAQAQKTALSNRIGTLNDAVDMEMATPEELIELPKRKAQLVEWKRYAILLGRVTSQEGWPPDVEWPAQPAEGMDLTVSAVAPDSPLFQ